MIVTTSTCEVASVLGNHSGQIRTIDFWFVHYQRIQFIMSNNLSLYEACLPYSNSMDRCEKSIQGKIA